MTKSYIVIQIIGFIGTIMFFVSFQCRNNKTLFRFQLLCELPK
ncbi:MAG: YgjV family protein [Eubacteriales bacterium]|nr:YgjV family protein [Eubacteriales bacterium]